MKLLYEPCKMNCCYSQASADIYMATRDAKPSSPHCNRKAHKTQFLWLINTKFFSPSKPHKMVNNLNQTVYSNNRCYIEYTENGK